MKNKQNKTEKTFLIKHSEKITKIILVFKMKYIKQQNHYKISLGNIFLHKIKLLF